MRITYDVMDTQLLIVTPATTESDTAFTCDVPDCLVTEYLAAVETLKNAMGALERAIG